MRLAVFPAIWAIAILLAGSSIYAYLNVSKFRSDLQRLEAERYAVLARSLADTAEQGLRLGLTLGQLDNLGATIARLKARHPEVAGIAVVGEDCDTLFGDRERMPPPERLCRRRQRLGGVSFGDMRGVFRAVHNSFDQPAGHVVLIYPGTLLAESMLAATRDVVRATVTLTSVASVLCLLGTTLLIWHAGRGYAALSRALDVPAGAHEPEHEPEPGPEPALEPALAALVVARARGAVAVEQDLCEIESPMRGTA